MAQKKDTLKKVPLFWVFCVLIRDGPNQQPFIQAIAKAGFILGYEEGTFRANHEITRSELVVIIQSLGLEVNPKATLFDDADLVPVWAKPYVETAAEAGSIIGNGAWKFNPKASSTRAEAIILILGMLSNVK